MDEKTLPNSSATPAPFDPAAAVDFRSLKSRCRLREVSAARRDDPFDELIIDADTPVHWYEHYFCDSDRSRTGKRTDDGWVVRYLPELLLDDTERCVLALTEYTLLRRRCIALLGLCFAAGVATIEQVACVLGASLPLTRTLVRKAFAAGLVDLGFEAIDGSFKTRFERGTTMVRLNHRDRHAGYLARLTPVERLSITGGANWPDSTNRSERHDVHALEFMLRVAEYTDVTAVFGERFSTRRLILGPPPRDQFHAGGADSVLLRGDGVRILVEHTASDSSRLTAKVHSYAEMLAQQDDLVVLFVVATNDQRQPNDEARAMARLGSAIDAATRKHPGTSMNLTRPRMAVVRWRDYFPSPGRVHPDFQQLLAFRRTSTTVPSGPAPAQTTWERASLLSPVDVPIRLLNRPPLGQWETHAVGLGQTPHWMRTAPAVNVLGDYMGEPLDPTICAALHIPADTRVAWRPTAPTSRSRAFTIRTPKPARPLLNPSQWTTGQPSLFQPYDPLAFPACPLHGKGLSLRKLARAHLFALSADYHASPGDSLYGMTTLLSILHCAKVPREGKFLRTNTVHTVLSYQYQWTKARAHEAIAAMQDILEEPIDADASIGWLLDPRSDGRRPIALFRAIADEQLNPQIDFPWEPPQLV